MRFLFINQYYAPDFAATAQQMTDLCEQLAAEGHEVHVLCSRTLYDGRPIELPAEEVLRGVHVHRVEIATGCRTRFRDRLKGYLSFYAKAFLKVHTLPRADVVVTLTTPPMISLLGTWLRIFRRSRFVYWVMDIYPDIARRANVISEFGPISPVWAGLGRISYLTANRVVVLGEDMKRVLIAKGVRARKIDVIQSWSCGYGIRPIQHEENPFRSACAEPGQFALMYSGNMGTCHTFDAVIAGIRQLSTNDKFRFVFIGSGKKEAELRRDLEGQDAHVSFLPYQDRDDLGDSLSAADAHLISLDPKFDGLLVPSKLYGIMAAGRPIVFVGSRHNEVARIIGEAQCGIVVDPDRPDDFVAALKRLAADPEETRRMGTRGREFFVRNFDVRISCGRFRALLEGEARKKGLRGARAIAHEVESAEPAYARAGWVGMGASFAAGAGPDSDDPLRLSA